MADVSGGSPVATSVRVRGWNGNTTELLLSNHVAKYPSIAKSLTFSVGALERVGRALADRLHEPNPSSPTVAIAGSLARFEASSCSDLDYMIIYPEEPSSDAAQFRDTVQETLASVSTTEQGPHEPFNQPNPKGVFKGDINGRQLVSEIGARSEDYKNVSRRLLLLLESQPLWNEALFDSLRTQIVAEYTKAVRDDSSKQFVLLLNDLVRYFRTICVHYHNEMQTEYGKWPIRNIKLRHSRVLMYASLLVVLGELSKFRYAERRVTDSGGSGKVRTLEEFLGCPPLERFVRVYAANDDDNLFRLLGAYNHFLEQLSNPMVRKELAELEYEDRYTRSAFASLKSNSDSFAAEVARFINARHGQWSDRFFEYLLL
jgi:putative nucleotidyltransferase DUF294